MEMYIRLFIILLVGFGSFGITAQETLPILQVISSGDINTSEITFDGEAICVGNDQGTIRRLDPENGNVLELLYNENITTCGLGFDGQYFLGLSKNKDKIYYLETDNLSVVDSIVPDTFAGYIHGIAWDEELVWYTIFHFGKTDTIYSYNPVTAETTRAPFMDNYSKGVAWDGTFLWISDNSNNSNPLIYKIDRETLEEVAVYKAPGGKYPNGLTFDGEYLWLSNNETDSIYQLDIGLATDLKELKPKEKKLFAYPNPAKDYINLKVLDEYIGETIAIYNGEGRLVKREELLSKQMLIDMTQFPTGQYYIYINSQLEELVLMVD